MGAILRAVGVALAGGVGGEIGGPGAGVLAGVGALYAGIASFGGAHPARLRRMVWAAGAASFAAFFGSVFGPSDLLTILGTVLLVFLLSTVAEAGPDAAQVALLATGTLIVFSGLEGAAAHPMENALLMLGGGLGQAGLLVAAHPISRLAGERRAVGAVYLGLAGYARAAGAGALPDAGAAAGARELLRESARYGIGPELRKLWSELELADALRGNLAGLGRVGLSPENWARLTLWLDGAAEAVRRGRTLDRTLPTGDSEGEAAVWLARFGRTVAAEGAGELPTSLPVPRASLRSLLGIKAFRRAAGGHAMRYALAVGVSVAAYRFGRVDHGYWAPLAVAFCLRPDFAGTLTRGLGRVVGTFFGVALATGIVAFAHPSAGWLTGLALGAAWLTFALQLASYAGYSGALSFLVVVAITLSGASAATVGLERILATAVGSAVALGTALVWPRWEAGGARRALAVAFAAQAAYADAVAGLEGVETMAAARMTARAARLEAERVVGAAEVEPRWSRGGSLAGTGAALGRLAENAATILVFHVAALDPTADEVPKADLARIARENRGMAADLMG